MFLSTKACGPRALRGLVSLCLQEYSQGTPADPWSVNPLHDLQDYLSIPIVKESYQVFNPIPEELEQGQELFKQRPGHKISMIKSVISLEKLPVQNIPEVSMEFKRFSSNSRAFILFLFSQDLLLE